MKPSPSGCHSIVAAAPGAGAQRPRRPRPAISAAAGGVQRGAASTSAHSRPPARVTAATTPPMQHAAILRCRPLRWRRAWIAARNSSRRRHSFQCAVAAAEQEGGTDADRCAQGDQDARVPGRPGAVERARAGPARAPGDGRDRRRRRASASTTRPTAPPAPASPRTAEEIFSLAEMIVKVKEPLPAEYRLLREDQILFTYLHLAADLPQTEGLMQSGCVAIAYETVTDRARPAAAAGADERGRRADERPGRRASASRRCRAAPACCSAACRACTRPRWS